MTSYFDKTKNKLNIFEEFSTKMLEKSINLLGDSSISRKKAFEVITMIFQAYKDAVDIFCKIHNIEDDCDYAKNIIEEVQQQNFRSLKSLMTVLEKKELYIPPKQIEITTKNSLKQNSSTIEIMSENFSFYVRHTFTSRPLSSSQSV